MMTNEERLEMYKEKKNFIENVSKVFEAEPSGTTVVSVDYEIYNKQIDEHRTYTVEYVIVNYRGGAKSVRSATGNSNAANFRVVGELLYGGYYKENEDYESLTERGFVPVQLGESKLDMILRKTNITSVEDVYCCFSYCADGNDVMKVMEYIPINFGVEVAFDESGESFRVYADRGFRTFDYYKK